MTATRVGVVGAGGIGGTLGALLSQKPGIEVTFCVRRPFSSLTLSQDGHPDLTVPARTALDPAEAGPLDWVLLCTKAQDLDGAAAWLRAVRTGRTPVAVLQNGVEHHERIQPYAPRARTLPAVVHFSGHAHRPGRVSLRAPGPVEVPAGDLGTRFRALFSTEPIPVLERPDFRAAMWWKLAHAVAASVTAAVLVPVNVVGRSPVLRRFAEDLIAETLRVARAEGAPLSEDRIDEVLDRLAALPSRATSSMYEDRLRGAPLEHDALLGAVLRAAARHSLDAPCTRTMHSLLGSLSGATPPLSKG